jgi:hypothetical protein
MLILLLMMSGGSFIIKQCLGQDITELFTGMKPNAQVCNQFARSLV